MTERMSDARIADIEALVAASTPGKWWYAQIAETVEAPTHRVCDLGDFDQTDADGFFIADAPTAIRELLAEVRQLRAERDVLSAALKELYTVAVAIERQIPIATEDWHHDLFAATGNAFRWLSQAAALVNGGDDADAE